ncbi:hypothetical protein FHS42_001684 [Streptomyces zagrosensis]|uniref:Uncharacterized protein n=1 Tax=Streptomyces zagrosensis TaxID=1042984 RepID=A0A7W9UXH3_9ACTN|nr:hypothetical protein [Streptomyces zagrosensis]
MRPGECGMGRRYAPAPGGTRVGARETLPLWTGELSRPGAVEAAEMALWPVLVQQGAGRSAGRDTEASRPAAVS